MLSKRFYNPQRIKPAISKQQQQQKRKVKYNNEMEHSLCDKCVIVICDVKLIKQLQMKIEKTQKNRNERLACDKDSNNDM